MLPHEQRCVCVFEPPLCRAPQQSAFLVRVLINGCASALTTAPGFRHHGGMETRRRQRSHDHRLVQFVQESRDPTIATELGMPRSTAIGWGNHAPLLVTTTEIDGSMRGSRGLDCFTPPVTMNGPR